MYKSISLALVLALSSAPQVFAQDFIPNPAIGVETVEELQAKIADLEAKMADAKDFIGTRQPDLLELKDKIANADDDTTKIITDLKALAEQFQTGSDIQIAVRDSMEDVQGFIDQFRAGTPAQQKAAESLAETLVSMQATDAKRNELVGQALAQVRKLETMKGDLVALRIAGSFQEMAALYDTMVSEFEATVNQTVDVSTAIESMTLLPVQ
jgi:chromosome segregation ATPase